MINNVIHIITVKVPQYAINVAYRIYCFADYCDDDYVE